MNKEQQEIWNKLKYGTETDLERFQRLAKIMDTPDFNRWKQKLLQALIEDANKNDTCRNV